MTKSPFKGSATSCQFPGNFAVGGLPYDREHNRIIRVKLTPEDVCRYDIFGNEVPKEEFEACVGKTAARWGLDKKKREPHWSRRESFYREEINGWHAVMIKLLGPDDAIKMVHNFFMDSEKAATHTLRIVEASGVLAEAAKEGPGRPRTPEHRLVAQMVSVEAYIGSRLKISVKEALYRAAEKWVLSIDRMDKVYKENKLPKLGGSDLLRAFFQDIDAERVDKFIRQYLELEIK